MEKTLAKHRATLDTLWRQGLQGRSLLSAYTLMVDDHLVHAFDSSPDTLEGMSLIALGGYGRRELFPFSDIDLLLLYEEKTGDRIDKVAQTLFYPLWDAGLEVGHGVRTLAACLDDAMADFFFQVALLDARFIAGSEKLHAQLQSAYHARFVDGNRPVFLENMMLHRKKRRDRYGAHGYMLEPHIKESRGGLRDIQSMLWTAQVMFGLKSLAAMEEAALITKEDKSAIEEAWEQLIHIRNRLHYVSGRKNDQLFFEHQEEMAKAFGFTHRNGVLGVEYFMQKVHEHMQSISVATDLFFDHVHEVIGSALGGKDRAEAELLESNIISLRSAIHLLDPEILKDHPHQLMRVFLQSARTGLPIHHRTRGHVKNNLGLVTDKFRHSRIVSRSFLDILTTDEEKIVPALETMLESGFLSAFLPEFSAIASLAQHDIYHVYTVDRHLLETVGELIKLREREERIYNRVGQGAAVLYLAGLLHDIGKGRGEEHAEAGAGLVGQVGVRLGLAEQEREDLVFLVRQHLFLAHTAQRRDLEDEKLIVACARVVGTVRRLDMLYLLTVADARATGPAAWSDWKEALLFELYLRIAHIFEHGELRDPQVDQTTVVEWMKEQVRAVVGQESAQTLDVMPTDYLLHFEPEEIVAHLVLRARLLKDELIVVPAEKNAAWSLLVVTTDRPGLLAKICGVLALHHLKVLQAQIFTWDDGTVVDSIHVASTINLGYEEQEWEDLSHDLADAVNCRIGLDYHLHKRFSHPVGPMRQPKAHLRTEVHIDNVISDTYTVIEIYSQDRIGLLYDIARTLSDLGMNISRARIGTQADRVVDVFYVLDREGKKLEDKDYLEEVRRSLIFAASRA